MRGRGIALKYAKNTRRDQARVAVVVSKKVSKSAVVRGRIRRRIFEVVRANHQDIITHPIDMVFSVYDESFADMPSAEVQSAVARLVDRVNL